MYTTYGSNIPLTSYSIVRIEVLEWFKVTDCDRNSVRLSTIHKKIDTEFLDYIEIDIAKHQLKNMTPDDILPRATLKKIENSDLNIWIPPIVNYVFSHNEEHDRTILQRRVGHVNDEKVNDMSKLQISKDLPKRKLKRCVSHKEKILDMLEGDQDKYTKRSKTINIIFKTGITAPCKLVFCRGQINLEILECFNGCGCKVRKLWIFCTSGNHPPIDTLRFLLE